MYYLQEAICIICIIALNSHAAGSKHKSKILGKLSIDFRFFGNKENFESFICFIWQDGY